MLMNSGFVCESVFADDGFVAWQMHAGNIRYKPRRRVKLRRIDICLKTEKFFASLDCHYNLFEAAIAGTFANTVYCTFDLPGTCADGSEAICNCHAQVVVAMNTEDDIVDPCHVFL